MIIKVTQSLAGESRSKETKIPLKGRIFSSTKQPTHSNGTLVTWTNSLGVSISQGSSKKMGMSLLVSNSLVVSTPITSKWPKTRSSGSELSILLGMATGGTSKIDPERATILFTRSNSDEYLIHCRLDQVEIVFNCKAVIYAPAHQITVIEIG